MSSGAKWNLPSRSSQAAMSCSARCGTLSHLGEYSRAQWLGSPAVCSGGTATGKASPETKVKANQRRWIMSVVPGQHGLERVTIGQQTQRRARPGQEPGHAPQLVERHTPLEEIRRQRQHQEIG